MRHARNETHDPALTSWVQSANGHAEFPVQNLPLGVFAPSGGSARIGVAIGDSILDMRAVAEADLLPDEWQAVFRADALNPYFALAVEQRADVRRQLSRLLSDGANRAQLEPFLHDASACAMLMPARIGDYTDFYAGIHHANNVGKLFRPDNPLLPNYKHIPIGYHGRASSIRPSGTAVRRPYGQRKSADADAPVFGPCERLDFELELGAWIAGSNDLGSPVPIGDAGDHLAGICLLNDWSARDMQAWEYQPLGPFLAKSFHSTISPWVVTTEALAPFRAAQTPRPEGDPQPLPYLMDADDQAQGSFAIRMEVYLSTAQMRASAMAPLKLSETQFANMYWTLGQMIAHHSSNGCNLQPGDLFGTGTISSPDDGGLGSLLEMTRGGAVPIDLPGGETRTFLLDGDELEIRGHASASGCVPIGLGSCKARIMAGQPSA